MVTVPKKNSVGIVERPKTNITIPPQIGDAVLAAIIAKEYTNPQGIIPFSIPNPKKLLRDLVRIRFANIF